MPMDLDLDALDILLVAAFEPELAPLRAPIASLTPALARTIALRAVGIGLAAAAAGAGAALAVARPGAVVLLGTCGAYRESGLAVGEVVVARSVCLVDPAAIAGRSQFPEPMTTSLVVDTPLGDALARGAKRVRIATTLAITVDDAAAAQIAETTGSQAEHLEAHGVAAACAAHQVTFAAVLGVANLVGTSARAEWREHHREAEEAAARHVLAWLEAGAEGARRGHGGGHGGVHDTAR